MTDQIFQLTHNQAPNVNERDVLIKQAVIQAQSLKKTHIYVPPSFLNYIRPTLNALCHPQKFVSGVPSLDVCFLVDDSLPDFSFRLGTQ